MCRQQVFSGGKGPVCVSVSASPDPALCRLALEGKADEPVSAGCTPGAQGAVWQWPGQGSNHLWAVSPQVSPKGSCRPASPSAAGSCRDGYRVSLRCVVTAGSVRAGTTSVLLAAASRPKVPRGRTRHRAVNGRSPGSQWLWAVMSPVFLGRFWKRRLPLSSCLGMCGALSPRVGNRGFGPRTGTGLWVCSFPGPSQLLPRAVGQAGPPAQCSEWALLAVGERRGNLPR